VGGALFAWAQGLVGLIAAVVIRPADVELGWPVTLVWHPDSSGALYYYHLDSGGVWLSIAWVVLGSAALILLLRDLRRQRTDPRVAGAAQRDGA